MKLHALSGLVASFTAAISSVMLTSTPIHAGSGYRFVCDANDAGTPTTFAILPNGEKREFINWRSDKFTLAGYTPQVRCEQVSSRMNLHYDRGLKYVTHGTINAQPVLCVTSTEGGGCEGLLYTLKPDQRAQETLGDLIELNRRNFSGEPLIEAGCRTFVDIDALISGKLKTAEVVCHSR